ncbi:YidC/Oxa1 family membrane protein insertase [Paracholeplasma manati]|jgi:YidC/Oxa1 family membrane protein insertase|uniref:YidC/Oxa1 family membrane protein insertase n=1 Tax=Paracholeplasma manati TaxID=591373 RepID=A0ABT2Y4P6_9MOLU|nr:YidC/Oxa1 family membrane protein insertase [Paracholeplasma manati]MCV2231452.1 YidC/Oxa1 family membrane protein insertase [Paracholeplasma manati]MDG0889317.1 YidC/Oxa1 family membrane protein insertase [Paracholeplasma manati]MDX9807454.1 YidC/Oxa1 family membrane protein insertase [Acholeplasma sp.]
MRNYKKILAVFVVMTLLVVLSGCSGDPTQPIVVSEGGWFDWLLVIPIAWIMQFFGALFNNSFAMGIIITTIIVRTIAWPIYAKSNDLSIKMAVAQPEMQRVQAKYATRKDPESQQKMQMEMMAVYKKYGINFMGCLMPFLQMPIFLAMYQVVQRVWIVEKDGVFGSFAESVSNRMFLGIDLSKAGNFGAIYGQSGDLAGWILAIIVGLTMFALNYLAMKKPAYSKNTSAHNPQTSQAEQTQKMMKYMQYFMVFMMFSISLQSNSLALYWVVGNIYSIGQNLINRYLNEKKYEAMKNKDLVG